jgi:LisH
MSIVIKAEHIDSIVHKYLLEMGYIHSAYLFEKEANIDILSKTSKSIIPYALQKICEQALILRSLEIHQDI